MSDVNAIIPGKMTVGQLSDLFEKDGFSVTHRQGRVDSEMHVLRLDDADGGVHHNVYVFTGGSTAPDYKDVYEGEALHFSIPDYNEAEQVVLGVLRRVGGYMRTAHDDAEYEFVRAAPDAEVAASDANRFESALRAAMRMVAPIFAKHGYDAPADGGLEDALRPALRAAYPAPAPFVPADEPEAQRAPGP